MIGKALWQSLKVLVTYDQEIIQTLSVIVEKKNSIVEMYQKISDLTQQLSHFKEAVTSAQKEADMLQLQANSLRENEEQKRNKLDNVKDQREYMALEKELSMLMKKRHLIEESTITSWQHLELSKKKYEEALAVYDHKQDEFRQKIEQINNDVSNFETQIEICEKERSDHELTIPVEWRIRYNRMKNQVADPIVSVKDLLCSACFYSVSHQDFVRLKKQDILSCRNCYRFLYYDASEETSDNQAKY